MKKNYLLSSMLGAMLVAMPVSADVIGMHTAAAVGEKISIALNEDVKATLTWGNGDTEEIVFTGEELEVVVKHADFTISTDQRVTTLYCPDCQLTGLDLNEAPNLASLVCPNNQLEKLNVGKNSRLVELNCANNKLSSISLNSCDELLSLNVANNSLTSLSTPKLMNLKTLICSNNNLKSLSITSLRDLETLWCQGNEISSILFSSVAKPVQICAFDNQLETLKPAVLEGLSEIWLDNNQFSQLDFSANTTLSTLSASNNKLTLIKLNNEKVSKDKLEVFYVDGNQLMFNSFPSVYNTSRKDSLIAYNIDNQIPYVYDEKLEKLELNTKYDFSELIRKNGWGSNIRPEVVWKDGQGNVLVKNQDYKSFSSNTSFTFLKDFAAVYGEVTSVFYPGATLRFAKMQVGTPTGIEDLVEENALRVSAKAGMLQVSTPVATLVEIYNVSGALLVKENVAAGSYSWTLPAGIYIVNGKKVVLNR